MPGFSPLRDATGIVFVIADLRGGGTQRVLAHVANALAGEGRTVTVVTLDGAGDERFSLAADIRRVVLRRVSPGSGPFLSNFIRLLRLRRALRDELAGTVMSFIGPTNVLAILASLGLGKRIVISERNDPDRQSFGPVWDWLRRRVYRYADVVTANSHGALATLAAYVPESRLAYLPNPPAAPADGPAIGWTRPHVLAVGRLHRQKAYDVLLDAFARFHARWPEWRLAMLGEGPLEAELRGQAERLGIAAAVEWPGFRDPFPYYRAARIFVLGSRHEGTPNALLEAMSQGVPCIVSDAVAAANPVQYGDGVRVVGTEDAAALAAALDAMAADPALARRIGEQGRAAASALAGPQALDRWRALIDGKPVGA